MRSICRNGPSCYFYQNGNRCHFVHPEAPAVTEVKPVSHLAVENEHLREALKAAQIRLAATEMLLSLAESGLRIFDES